MPPDHCTVRDPCIYCTTEWVTGDSMVGFRCYECGSTELRYLKLTDKLRCQNCGRQ